MQEDHTGVEKNEHAVTAVFGLEMACRLCLFGPYFHKRPVAFAPIQLRKRDEGEEYCYYPDQRSGMPKVKNFCWQERSLLNGRIANLIINQSHLIWKEKALASERQGLNERATSTSF